MRNLHARGPGEAQDGSASRRLGPGPGGRAGAGSTARAVAQRAFIIAAVGLLVLSGRPCPLAADGGPQLGALVAARFGVARTSDPTLAAVAAVRVVEIASAFTHRPLPELSAWNWGEVIAANRGYADPYAQAIEQWWGSAPHHAILANPAYQRIGCDHRTAAGQDGVVREWFVCIVGTPPGSAPPPAAGEIPDTATRPEGC